MALEVVSVFSEGHWDGATRFSPKQDFPLEDKNARCHPPFYRVWKVWSGQEMAFGKVEYRRDGRGW